MRKPTSSEVKWAECSLIIGTGYRFQVFAWPSIAQSACEWAFGPLAIWCLRLPKFESCIQQRQTTCLLSIWKSLACARASKCVQFKHINSTLGFSCTAQGRCLWYCVDTNGLINCNSCTQGREDRVMRNRYSRLLFTSEDRISANLRVREQSTNMASQCYSISRSRDVTYPLLWRHNAKSETTVLGDNCEMSYRWLFLAELCVQVIK